MEFNSGRLVATKARANIPNPRPYTEEVQPLDLVLARDVLFIGVALEWVKQSLVVFASLRKPHPTAENIQTIKCIIDEQFPARAVELFTQAFQK